MCACLMIKKKILQGYVYNATLNDTNLHLMTGAVLLLLTITLMKFVQMIGAICYLAESCEVQ